MYKQYEKDTIQKARRYREKGLSLREISERISHHGPKIPVGTIGNWVRDIILSQKQQKRLRDKEVVNRNRLIDFDRNKYKKTNHKKWYNMGKSKTLSEEDIIGLIIYACEGLHSTKSQEIHLANSDPNIVIKFMEMIERYGDIPRKRWKVRITLHEFHDIDKTLNYWKKKLGVEQITIQEIRKGGRRKKPGYMGCIYVRVCDIKLRCELEGLIDKYTGRIYPICQNLV